MPDITEHFEVDQPAGAVWGLLQNVPEVVTCIPGFTLTGQDGEATYKGKVRIRLGPVVGAFEGEATIVEVDENSRTTRIEGQGLDRQGGSRASATVSYTVSETDGGARVDIAADMKLTGALAQMGRTGIVKDVAGQITKEFAKNLSTKLAAAVPAEASTSEGDAQASAPQSAQTPAAPAAEISGGTILLRAFLRSIARLFGFGR